LSWLDASSGYWGNHATTNLCTLVIVEHVFNLINCEPAIVRVLERADHIAVFDAQVNDVAIANRLRLTSRQRPSDHQTDNLHRDLSHSPERLHGCSPYLDRILHILYNELECEKHRNGDYRRSKTPNY
jgi:hypothetical protein